MPRIRVILEDDLGKPMPDTEQVYTLSGNCDTINHIEAAVEEFRKQALPDLEKSLLTQAQQQFVAEKKTRKPSA